MKRLTFLLGLIITTLCAEESPFELLPSAPEQMGIFSQVDEFLVGGVVSPMSGQVCLQKTDLVAKGAENVRLHRTYIASHVAPKPSHSSDIENHFQQRTYFKDLQRKLKGWVFLPQLYLEYSKTFEFHLPTPEGTVYDFRREQLASLYGVSNASGGRPSGAYDPRNIRISHEGHHKTVQFPDGTTRIYERDAGYGGLFRLEKEILGNGRVIRYFYRDDHQIKRIESRDPTEKFVYASIDIEGQSHDRVFSYEDKWNGGSCGKYKGHKGATEDLDGHGFPYYELSSAQSSSGGFSSYKYDIPIEDSLLRKESCGKFLYHISLPLSLKAVSSSLYREEAASYDSFRLKQYADEKRTFECTYSGDSRVETLSFPVGENGAMIPVYRLSYDPPVAGARSGGTTVTRCDGLKIVYHFSQDFLVEKIQWHSPDGKLQKEKKFVYDGEHRLKSVELRDGEKLFYTRTYGEYDPFGNAQLETFEGLTVRRRYSQDGRNLLIREEQETGKVLRFEYLPNTNLLQVKYTCEGDKVLIEERRNYDAYNNLIEAIVTDGVAQRTLTRYTLRQEQPFLHMPEAVEELYWDGSQEVVLKKTTLEYDQWGNVFRETVYNKDGKRAFCLTKEFDEQGNILSETNALGQTATTTYDLKGHPRVATNFSGKLLQKMTYDAQGRLEEREEQGGSNHKTTYTYDHCDRCQTVTDYLGNVSAFEHDLLSGEVTQTIRCQEVESSATYDALGRKLTETDANGYTTTHRYNAYDAPIEITHPSGAVETFSYYNNGWLKTHVDRNDLTVTHITDVLGRVREKEFSHEGKVLAKELFEYDAFHLRSQTDKEGNVTLLEYDRAGREVKKTESDHVTESAYDALGRLSAVTKSSLVVRHFERDFFDRITGETQTDLKGTLLSKIGYEYDGDGNQSRIHRYPHNQRATVSFEYDSFKRLIEEKDAEGHSTVYRYDETGGVLVQTATDPNQIVTVTTYDSHGRPAVTTIGELYREEKTYDPAGNLAEVREGSSVTKYTYTPENQVASVTRGYGMEEAKTTSYTYTPFGEVETKTLPGGIVLSYTYWPFRYLKTLTSSDGTIQQQFSYNLNGYLEKASNVKRVYDRFGNLLEETVDGRLTLLKTYDTLNRLRRVTLPDGSHILYDYDALYLRAVTRGEYTHTYDEYDLSGCLLKENGSTSHTYTPQLQRASLSSPYFTQVLEYDAGGRIKNISSEGAYTYDDLSQLKSEPSAVYSYDAHFNRNRKNDLVIEHNAVDEIKSAAYDANGNLTQYGPFGYTYDALNELIRAEKEDLAVEFTYDALGRRCSKSVAGQMEYYLYHGTEELGSFTEEGALKELKVPGLYTRPIALELEGKLFVPICDYKGSIRRLVDPVSAAIVQQFDYTAFGEGAIVASTNPWRYSAKRLDLETGLYYCGKRYYSPELGRWLSTDPAGFVDSTNLYQYLFNDPLSYHDPEGKAAIPLISIAFGTGVITPVGWAAIAVFGVGYLATWSVKTMINNGSLEHGGLGHKAAATVVSVGATLQNTWDTWAYSAGTARYSPCGDAGFYYTYHYSKSKSQGERHSSDTQGAPPYRGDQLGNDPSRCPDKGFEWKGKGKPGSGQGSWVRGPKGTQESLHPDLAHPDPIGPHWDYESPQFPTGARLYPDGTWSPK